MGPRLAAPLATAALSALAATAARMTGETRVVQPRPGAAERFGSAYAGFVDALYERAVAAGATVVRKPEDQDYGGRGCTLRDPEGNQWSFGSYRGE